MSTSPIRARLACGSLRNDGSMLTTSMLGIFAKRSRIWSPVVPASPSIKTFGMGVRSVKVAKSLSKPVFLAVSQ